MYIPIFEHSALKVNLGTESKTPNYRGEGFVTEMHAGYFCKSIHPPDQLYLKRKKMRKGELAIYRWISLRN